MDNNVGTITLSTEVDTKGVDKGLVDIERKVTGKGFMNKFSRMFSGIFSKASSGASKLTSSINKGMTSIIKDIGSIASGVSGIGTIIAAISLVGIIGMVALAAAKSEEARQQLEQIANIIIGIIDALGNLLLPIAETIVDWIYKAVGIFGIFLKDILGIDLATKSVSNNMKKTTKSAKELRKQLLGFDEMNILNKDGTTGALGGLGGNGSKTTTKDYGIYNDMSGLNKGLADLGVVAVYTGDDLKETRLQLEQLIADAKNGKATMTKANGIVTIIDKVGNTIKFTTNEYERLLDDINNSRVTSRNLDIWWKVKDAFQGWNIQSFKKYMGKAISVANDGSKSMQKEIEIVKQNFLKNLDGATYSFKDGIYEIKMTNGEIVKLTKEQWAELQPYMKYVGLNIVSDTNNTGGKIQTKSAETKNKVVKDAKEARDEILGYIDDISGANNKTNSDIQEGANGTANGVTSSWGAISKGVSSALAGIEEDSKTSSKKSADNVKEEYKGLPGWMENNVFVKLLKEFGVLGTDTGQTFGKGLKDAINKVLDKIENSINSVFTTATNMFKKFGISVPIPKVKFPRLAKGGIINQPGRGINYGMANIGERGREGVIPLDNQSALNTIADAIANKITINLTSVTELDGRVIARNVTQVMNDMNFASNGGVI